MKVGKLPPSLLLKYVLSRLGISDPAVIMGPRLGEDAAIIDIGGGRVLVIHSDPITEAIERIGWLAIHVASNDLAVRGVKPRWFLVTILLPQGADVGVLDEITKQLDRAAKEVGAMIVGGHTEVSPGIEKPIVIVSAAGICDKDKVVMTSGARVGDVVIMTKGAGIEGTAIIASDFKELLLSKGVSTDVIERAQGFFNEISVLPEALALSREGLVTSMHDPTEGGLLNGLIEIALASGKGIKVFEERVIVREETKVITKALSIDPLKLISSGTLIATVPRNLVDRAVSIIKGLGIGVSVIGEVVHGKGVTVVRRDGSSAYYEEFIEDEIGRLWEAYG